jgi:hypothetical protein
MMDITVSGSFEALAEAIRLNELVKSRRGWVSPTLGARSDPTLDDLRFPGAATVIAVH